VKGQDTGDKKLMIGMQRILGMCKKCTKPPAVHQYVKCQPCGLLVAQAYLSSLGKDF